MSHIIASRRSVGTMLPTFPDVELKPLPFYDIKDVLLKPASLQVKEMIGKRN